MVAPQEQELLLRIRTRFRYGEIRIETKDGLPYRIGAALSWEKVDEPVYPQPDIDSDTLNRV